MDNFSSFKNWLKTQPLVIRIIAIILAGLVLFFSTQGCGITLEHLLIDNLTTSSFVSVIE